MITYERLSRRAKSAPSLIGMPLAAFDKLYAEFEPIHHQRLRSARLIRRTKTPHRIVVEHTIAQMNKFQVLRQVFRHNWKPTFT